MYLGRDYPLGYTDYFRPRLHDAFMKNKDLTSEHEIEQCIKLGEHVRKGTKFATVLGFLYRRNSSIILFKEISDFEEEV